MKKVPRLCVLLAVLAGGFAAPASAALTDPAQIQTEAYVNLVQADQSLDAGRLDEALTQYNAARDYYLQLAKDFPGWEPRVIQYRKTYCDNQIADVERRRAGGSAEPAELEPLPEESPAPEAIPAPAVAAAEAEPEPEPAPVADRSVEIDYLKSRVASLEAELAEFEKLQNESDARAAENKRLAAELETAQRTLADRDGAAQAAQADLRAQLAQKDDQIQALEKNAEAKKQLDQALNDLEAKVNDLRAENDRLQAEIKNLDAELDDAEVRADQAELKAKQAEDKRQGAETALQAAERETQQVRDQQSAA